MACVTTRHQKRERESIRNHARERKRAYVIKIERERACVCHQNRERESVRNHAPSRERENVCNHATTMIATTKRSPARTLAVDDEVEEMKVQQMLAADNEVGNDSGRRSEQ